MVSVKRFIHDEPQLFESSKAFVKLLLKCMDPIIYAVGKMPDENTKIAWTLLGTALFQNRTYPDILRLLLNLYERFPDDKLWALPVPKASEIESVIEQTFNSRNWPLFEHAAGIFWSVGLFVRHHPDLVAWVRERSPKEMWRDLGEIYFMGRSNPRPKACAAIYRMLSPSPLGLGLSCRDSRKMPSLPLTMGARRFLAMLGPAKGDVFSEISPQEKQKLANDYFVALAPENPYFAAHSLQFFLENGTDCFICRELTQHCAKCPLYEYCNYADVQKQKKDVC